jgi:Hypothetical protein (DUF2513)
MKRDMDLARKILEQVEEKDDGEHQITLEIPEYPTNQVHYNVKLLKQHGLLEAIDCSTFEGAHWMPVSLTWEGHEFLDAIRNDTVWQKVKEAVKEQGGSITFEALKLLALKLAASAFGVGG